MYRKILAFAAAAALVFGAAAAPAQISLLEGVSVTASADTYEDYEYEVLDDGTVEITAYNGSDTAVDIPSEIDGKAVTSIGIEAFDGRTDITSLTIPESVTYIGRYAFSACDGLTRITIPDSVTVIDAWAFFCCTNLAEINFPSDIREIGLQAFYNTAWIDNKRNEDPFVIVNNILIDAKACTGSVEIPDGVTRIVTMAFGDSEGVTDIFIPASVTDIEDFIFPDSYSPDFSQITVDENNPNYASVDGVLYNKDKTELICCPLGKTSVSIPDSVTVIYLNAFVNCKDLTSIDLPNGIREICSCAFALCTGLTSVVIPDSTQIIGESAFENCTEITSVVLPEGVTSICARAFFNCPELVSVTIPASVTEIGGSAFGYGVGYVPELEDYSDYLKFEGFIIRGYRGTAAEQYAENNGFEFVALDGESSTPDLSNAASSSNISANSSISANSGGSTVSSSAVANTGVAAGTGAIAALLAFSTLIVVKKKNK